MRNIAKLRECDMKMDDGNVDKNAIVLLDDPKFEELPDGRLILSCAQTSTVLPAKSWKWKQTPVVDPHEQLKTVLNEAAARHEAEDLKEIQEALERYEEEPKRSTTIMCTSGFDVVTANGDVHVNANAMVAWKGRLLFWFLKGKQKTKVQEFGEDEYIRVVVPTRTTSVMGFRDYKDRGPSKKVTLKHCKNCGTVITGQRKTCGGRCRKALCDKRKRGELHDGFSGYKR
jgi:hypothetical protein